MSTNTTTPKRITDIGPPHYEKYLPPIVKKNYGKWVHHESVAPGVLCHIAESGDRLYSVRAGTPRLLGCPDPAQVRRPGRQILRRPSALHQPAQHRVPAGRSGEDRATQGRPGQARLPGRRDRQLHQQHRAHPGMDPLPFGGDRRVGHRQGGNGRALQSLHQKRSSGQAAHRSGLLREHVRRRALLRHRHPRHSPHAAQGEQAMCWPAAAKSRR